MPMGGDLRKKASKAPTFAVWALKDPESGNPDSQEISLMVLPDKQDQRSKTMRGKTGRVLLPALLPLCAALFATGAWAQSVGAP